MGIDMETEAYRADIGHFDVSTQPTRREGLAIAFLLVLGSWQLTRSSVMSGKTICLGCGFHLLLLRFDFPKFLRNAANNLATSIGEAPI
jgi:hypothetical protein